jgi:GAF domain-containing protein
MTDPVAPEERVGAYVRRISDGPDFPALADRVREAVQILSGEDMTMQRLANIILKDYSLTTKVLRTANSFHYNRSGTPIFSVTQAMVLLGVENVRDLASSLIVFEHYQGKSPGLKELMLLSMLTASHARNAAEHVGYANVEEAHLRGMFRNLGEVLVASHGPADYAEILARVRGGSERVGDACLQVLGFHYAELGEAVCRLWGIVPARAAVRTENEEWLDRIIDFSHELTTAVYRREGGDSPSTLSTVMHKHGAALGLSRDTLRSILERGIVETREVFSSLSVSINDLRLRRQTQAALASLATTTAGPETDATEPPAAVATAARDQLVQPIEAAMASPARFDLNETLLTLLEAVLRGGPFDRTAFCVANAERTEGAGRFGLGPGVEAHLARVRFQFSQARATGAGPALRRGVDFVVSIARRPSADEMALLQHLGVNTVALLPVLIDDKLVGAIYADRLEADTEPDPQTVAFLRRARDLATRALARARGRGDASPRPRIAPAAKSEAVLRLLRGEPIETVSRDLGVAVAELDAWRRAFLTGARAALDE